MVSNRTENMSLSHHHILVEVSFLSFRVNSVRYKRYEKYGMFSAKKKQNRESTEGYSKSIVRKNNHKFGKRIGLNK